MAWWRSRFLVHAVPVAAVMAALVLLTTCAPPAHPPDQPPPFFEVTFGVMVVGIPIFLFGGGLAFSVIRHGSPLAGSALRAALTSDSLLALVALSTMFLAYPLVPRARRAALKAYLLFFIGSFMVFGSMLYWGWWYEQLPWQ